jgi:hypothetical protein
VAASPHPLDGLDRPVIERLLTVTDPSDTDLVNAARLHARYKDSLLSPDLLPKVLQAMENWSLSLDELHARTREIWRSGWRPRLDDSTQEQPVGSGADMEG